MRSFKINLIGETCKDITTTVVHERNSPEDPTVPVYKVKNIYSNYGMSYNVKEFLKDILSQAVSHITNPKTDCELIKNRTLLNDKQIFRLDSDKLKYTGLKAIEECTSHKNPHFWIVSDYGKGLINKQVMDYVRSSGVPIYVDPHPNTPLSLYKGADMIKLNLKELLLLTGKTTEADGILYLHNELNIIHVFVTKSEDGIVYSKQKVDGTLEQFVHTSLAKGVTIASVAAAGDVCMALLSLMLFANCRPSDMVYYTMKAAAIHVTNEGDMSQIRTDLSYLYGLNQEIPIDGFPDEPENEENYN